MTIYKETAKNILTKLKNTTRQTETPAGNSTYKKLAVQCSADTFVVNQTLVFRINIFGENRQLLVAAIR